MSEHTSKDLSKRLFEKGFRGEHTSYWHFTGWQKKWNLIINHEDGSGYGDIPAYTFTEIWKPLTMPERYELIKHIQACFERDDLAEIAGEWLIDNGHIARTALQEGKDG
jgi:hypothetical protein